MRTAYLSLLLVLLTAGPGQAITPCWKALQTMEDGKGLKECARLYEEDGDSLAAYYLSGFALLRGNDKVAMNWLWSATLPTKQYSDGFRNAQYDMGKNVLYGKHGVEIDTTVAYNLFDAATKQGFAPAYYEWARMLERGLGHEASNIAEATGHYAVLSNHTDYETAVTRLEGLCGDADSAYELAEYYLVGDDTSIELPEKDPEEAYLLFSIASHLGHDEADGRASKISKELSDEEIQSANAQLSRWARTDLSEMDCNG